MTRPSRPVAKFTDRLQAGQQLAARLTHYADRSDVIVLGLPRGGVPIAHAVATQLKVPFDTWLVRKLGVPGHPELAMGAIAEGGVRFLNRALIRDLGIPERLVEQTAVGERLELERRDRLYRGGRGAPVVRDRTVIVVDDGLATGATMEAAVAALREQSPARIVVAAPVGARSTCERLASIADEVVCVSMPDPFDAVGMWYDNFAETSDEEVQRLLSPDRVRRSGTAPDALDVVRRRAISLSGAPDQYDALIQAIGDAQVVLIGEGTHGTHEFYRERAFITRRLIVEKGFTAVAVEADWPDAYRINRYVRGSGPDQDAADALADFGRFPTWMWRNADVLDFVGWLRTHNDGLAASTRVGFYGLDLYSLRASMQAVLRYLDTVDPMEAQRARERYACFDRFDGDFQRYGYWTTMGANPSCENDVVSQLLELRRQQAAYASRDGRVAADDFFVAAQNARLVQNAEAYYRSMFRGRASSWNLRDRHMAETLDDLRRFLERDRPGARIVVWAHNSHLGDARATDMSAHGELNLGQLIRERFGARAFLVGATTYSGTVTAASEWDGPAFRLQVRPALAGSYERLFHEAQIPRMLLPLRTDLELASALAAPRLERAIGVLYLPQSERASHYFHARLPQQFDAVLHFDQTRAVEPLERTEQWHSEEAAETFPTGL